MKAKNKERRIVSRIVRQLSKAKSPDLLVSEMSRVSYKGQGVIDEPGKAAKCFGHISDRKQEHFAVATLNSARQLISCHIVTVGTLTSSLVHPREIFALALEDRAASIIVAHNHPSGSMEISENDKEASRTLRAAGEIMNIPVDDHLVVSGGKYASAMYA